MFIQWFSSLLQFHIITEYFIYHNFLTLVYQIWLIVWQRDIKKVNCLFLGCFKEIQVLKKLKWTNRRKKTALKAPRALEFNCFDQLCTQWTILSQDFLCWCLDTSETQWLAAYMHILLFKLNNRGFLKYFCFFGNPGPAISSWCPL